MMNQKALTMATFIVFGILGSAHAVPLSGTGFSEFIVGLSVEGQGGWSSDNPAWDEEVALDGTNYVWRVSNAVTSGSFGDMPLTTVESDGTRKTTFRAAGSTTFATGKMRGIRGLIQIVGSAEFREGKAVSTSGESLVEYWLE